MRVIVEKSALSSFIVSRYTRFCEHCPSTIVRVSVPSLTTLLPHLCVGSA